LFAYISDSDENSINFHYESDSCSFQSPIDSGWQSLYQDSIQVRSELSFTCNSDSVFPGKAFLYWGDENKVNFIGESDKGNVSENITISVMQRLKIDIDTDIVDIDWEGPVPGSAEFEFPLSSVFDPFLLLGNPDRPLVIEQNLPRTHLIELGLNDFVGIPGEITSLDLFIDYSGRFHSSIIGNYISSASGDAFLTNEGQPLYLPELSGENYEFSATYCAYVVNQLALTYFIYVRLEYLVGTERRELEKEIELPIIAKEWEENWQIGPQNITFSLPKILILDTNFNSLNQIYFQDILINSEITQKIIIFNEGNKSLKISASTSLPFSIHSDLSNQVEILPGNFYELIFSFKANDVGYYTGNLNIESNDPMKGDIILPIIANVIDDNTDNNYSDYIFETSEVSNGDEINYEYSGCGCII